ncbi:Sodium/hydrogen exchanger family-domain-containing protein, partial [Cubamyces menziesii]
FIHKPVSQVTEAGLAYLIIGGFVVAVDAYAQTRSQLYINEVVLGTACGVILGPYYANVVNPRALGVDVNTVTLEVTRITLAAGLFAIGVELPQAYLAKHVKGLLFMIVPTMAFGWLIVAAVIYTIFPPLNFLSSLVIAACLTPTDPIISAAIISGKYATANVQQDLRDILSAESAANDGLAYPFLSISIYLTIESSRRVAIGEWFLVGCLYQVVLGALIGALLGVVFSYLLQFSHRKGYIGRESYVVQYLALALFTIGITRTLGSDDLLAAFAAGTAIGWSGNFKELTEKEVFASVIDLVLNCGCFIYIGAWIPFDAFNATQFGITPWRLIILFVAVILLRRIPPLLLLYRWVPEIKSWKEALFSGHFGPMGVGAIFVSTLAVLELPTPHDPPQSQAELLAATLQTIVSSVVLGSIVIHGLSITVLSLGTSVCSRTLTLTRSWTAPNGSKTPEWLVFVRRVPIGSVRRGPLTINDRDVERDADTKSDHPSTPRPRLVYEVTEIDRHLPALGLTTLARGAIPVPLDCDGGQTHDFHGSSHLPLESDTSEVRSFQ